MKIRVHGDTPMERLTNLVKGLVAVPKSEVVDMEKKWRDKRVKRKKR